MRRIFRSFALALCLLVVPSAGAQEQPATQPTTQTTLAGDNESIAEALARTRLGEIVRGKDALTWNTIRDPSFWTDTVKELIVTVILFIPRFVGTMLFLFVFWLIYRGIRRVVMGSIKSEDVDSSISNLLGAMIKWLVMGFGVVIACNQLGIPIVAMLTGVSLVGLAVGFAAQETISNFIAGIVIFLDKPFRIGDWIELDGTFGQVKRVSFRATRLLSLDGDVHIFPNTQVLSSHVVNHTTNPINRVNVPVGIAYRSSIDEARRVLLELTKEDARLVKTPAPEVVVAGLGDSSVNLVLRFWLQDESLERRVVYEYNEKAKKALDAAGIEIPFPHMQVFLEDTPAVQTLARARGTDGNSRTHVHA